VNRAAIDGSIVAVPSKGRLREEVVELLSDAGYPVGMLSGAGSIAQVGPLGLIEMRPRDAASALAAGQLDAAFVATDLVREHDLEHLPAVELGFSRSDLVLAGRDDDPRASSADLEGGVIATHLPRITEKALAERGVSATVVTMGGSLEGVCAAGLADAIVDLRETGTSLAQNGLRVIEELGACQALLVRRDGPDAALDDLELRVGAVLEARKHRYVMLHVPRDRVDDLRGVFPGLASPTVLPLAGRDDLVAVHFVVAADELWGKLGQLRAMGATGIVALPPGALLP
jgi:ATP phosphoribosyltransferase